MHVEEEVLFSGVASHSTVYWCPLGVSATWVCRPSVHALKLSNIE